MYAKSPELGRRLIRLMRMWQLPYVSGLILSVGLLVTGRGQSARLPWTHIGVVRYALTGGDVLTLNPVLGSTTVEDELDALWSNLLVGVDPHGHPFAELAERVPSEANGDISRDGRSITYHLRRGVIWHDGSPFTSRDVRFSWEAVMNPRNNVLSRSGYDLVDRVLVPDSHTVVFLLKRPFAPAVMRIFGGGGSARLIPEHLLAKYSDLNRIDFNQHPIGTGPFKVVSWTRGQTIELERNESYFLGKPKLSHMTILIVPSYETAGVMLRSHELDFARLDSASYLAVRGLKHVRAELGPLDGFTSITINVTAPYLRDRIVRRAIGFGIDKASLVRKNTVGAVPADSDILPGSWAHTESIEHYGYDRRQAARLLDSAGWHARSDGLRYKNGTPLVLDLVQEATSVTDQGLGIQVQSMLRGLGIDVRLRSLASAILWAPASEGGVAARGKFDLLLGGSGASRDPDNSPSVECAYAAPNGPNLSRYCNPAVDALERRALSILDLDERRRLYDRIERTLSEDLPVIPLFWSRSKFGLSADLYGFNPNGVTTTWNAFSWSI